MLSLDLEVKQALNPALARLLVPRLARKESGETNLWQNLDTSPWKIPQGWFHSLEQ